MNNHVLAIDAGTGSCRAVVFDRNGEQISFAQREWSHPTVPRFPGSQVFETKPNWRLICECIRESTQKIGPYSIKAVSATSMREGMVLYDRDGREIWACPNVDSRASVEAERLVKTGMARKIYFRSGDWVSITSTPRFLWIKNYEPEIYKRTAHMGMLADWILYRLSGRFATEPSIGSSSGMFDLKKRRWSKEIIEICGLDQEIFPEIVQAGNAIGEVTEKASQETGLPKGTQVIAGGGDTQLGLLGLGITKPGQVTFLGGSFWQHTILLGEPTIDPKIRLRTLCSVLPNQWMMEGIGFYCGLTMRWFRDAFCQKEKEEATKLGVDPYVLMEKEASSVPAGSNGVVGIFSNIMDSKKWVHASPSFIQFDITNPQVSGKKECIRAIEEAAAYVSYGHLKIIESLSKRKTKEITFTAGGAKSNLWPQILADVTGVRIKIPKIKESTARGAALCAAVGAGYYDDLLSAAQGLPTEKEFEPSQRIHKQYEDLYESWYELYRANLGIANRGLAKSLWRAAGA